MTKTSYFGFWVYILSDCVLFASLFATYAVLAPATAHGPTGAALFSLPFVFVQTLILLASSFTMGIALVTAEKSRPLFFLFLLLTLGLGLAFLGLEFSEFRSLILEGNGPDRSAFLSAFWGLVGTHGLHVALGSLWMLVVAAHVMVRGIGASLGKLRMLALFWHFLDVIWVFIFTFVYLFGLLA